MKNILIRSAVAIMLSALNIVFQGAWAMNSAEINPEENNYMLTQIVVDSTTYTRYKNDVIFRFDETIDQRFGTEVQIYGAKAQESDTIAQVIERSQSYGGDESNIKLIMVRVPDYTLSALAIYEEGFDSSILIPFNLHQYDLSKSSSNASGYLSIPNGEGPFPCAILCHGSEGDGFMKDYMNSLVSEGIAVVSINRFIHRMYQYADKDGNFDGTTGLNQLKISLEAEIIDTLRVAQLMGTHPKIDKMKIGFIGWSRGGSVALECSMQRNIDMFLPNFQPAFCVNYYTMPLIQRKDMPVSPLLFLHGANDDYTPVSCLINYINFLLDQDIALTDLDQKAVFELDAIKIAIYPKSGHAFDGKQASFSKLFSNISNPQEFIGNVFGFFQSLLKESSQLSCPDIMNMSDCCVRSYGHESFIDADGQERSWSEFPDYIKSKIKYGVTLEFNPKAGIEAWQEALEFIKKSCTTESLL